MLKIQNVIVEPLSPTLVSNLNKALNFPDTKEKHFGSPLYCKPIRRLTPKKLSQSVPGSNSHNDGLTTSTP